MVVNGRSQYCKQPLSDTENIVRAGGGPNMRVPRAEYLQAATLARGDEPCIALDFTHIE